MTSAEVVVVTGTGLHARPAATLVAEARTHRCKLSIDYEDRHADMKSIIQVLSLGVRDHERVRLTADGEGEEQALAAVEALFNRALVPDSVKALQTIPQAASDGKMRQREL